MLCVIALLDPASMERLSRLRRLTAAFGVPPRAVHGHITLASYTGGDEAGFISSCQAILSRRRKFSVHYGDIRIFDSTSVIVAIPDKEDPLDAIQREIADTWAKELNQWTRREAWQPHTSLFYSPEVELAPILGAMRAEFEPFSAQIDRIEFSRVDEEDRIETVGIVELP